MTTPTQAQIEAAANIILQWAIVPMEFARAKECAKAALTSAAQVGPSETEAQAIMAEAAALAELEELKELCVQCHKDHHRALKDKK